MKLIKDLGTAFLKGLLNFGVVAIGIYLLTSAAVLILTILLLLFPTLLSEGFPINLLIFIPGMVICIILLGDINIFNKFISRF